MIEVALATKLRQHANVGNKVSPSSESLLVSEDLPRVIYTLIKSEPEHTDDGPTGLVVSRWQVDIFTEKVTQGRTIVDAIRGGFAWFSGTVAGVKIDRTRMGNVQFKAGDRAEGSNKTPARFIVELFIVYRE